MAADPALVAGLPEAVASIYADAETQLLTLIAKTAAKGIDAPDWAVRQLDEIHTLNKAAQGLTHQMSPIVAATVQQSVQAAAAIGVKAANADIAAAGGVTINNPNIGVVNTAAVGALASETVAALNGTTSGILRSTLDVHRSVIADVAGRVVTGVITQRQALQQSLDMFAAKGITGFVDKAGRKWKIDTYAEMAMRTATLRALHKGHTARLQQAGHDLVIISHHPAPAPQCVPYEGRVVSLSGETPNGPITVKSALGNGDVTTTVVASMAEAEAQGLHHPNCKHTHTLWVPGASIPEPDHSDGGQRYRDQQTLRGLERAVRAAKRRKAVAVSPNAVKAANVRITATQGRIRDHVEATGIGRLRHREQLRVGKPGDAIEPVKIDKVVPLPPPVVKPSKPLAADMSPADLAAAHAKAATKVGKLKKPDTLPAMQAQAEHLDFGYHLKAAADPNYVATAAETLAGDLVKAAATVTAEGTDAAKVALSQAKKALQGQLLSDKADALKKMQAWLAAEADHNTVQWLTAEKAWQADVTDWLAAEKTFAAAEQAKLLAAKLAKAKADMTAWLDAENKFKAAELVKAQAAAAKAQAIADAAAKAKAQQLANAAKTSAPHNAATATGASAAANTAYGNTVAGVAKTAGLEKQLAKLQAKILGFKDPLGLASMQANAEQLVLARKITVAKLGKNAPAPTSAEMFADNLVELLEDAKKAKSAGGSVPGYLQKQIAQNKAQLQGELKYTPSAKPSFLTAKTPTTGTGATTPPKAPTGTPTTASTPPEFDAVLVQMVDAKKANNWAIYDPLKLAWAKKLEVSLDTLNGQINRIVHGGVDPDDVKHKLADLKGKKPPAPPKVPKGAANPAQHDITLYDTIVSDSAAPAGSAANPKVFPKGAGYGAKFEEGIEYFGTRYPNRPSEYDSASAKAIYKYSTSSGCAQINDFARSNKGVVAGSGPAQTAIKALDKAMDKAVRIEEHVVLSRGTGGVQFGLKPGQDPMSLVGSKGEDHAFISTSVGEEPAFGGDFRMLIKAPPGTKGVYLAGETGQTGDFLGAYGAGEGEYLLGRGLRWEVESVTKREPAGGWKYDIVVRVLGQA